MAGGFTAEFRNSTPRMVKHSQRYSNNIVAAFGRFQRLFIGVLVPLTLIATYMLYSSWHRIQTASARSYIFHGGGASIEIFEVFDRQNYRVPPAPSTWELLTSPRATNRPITLNKNLK